MQARCCPNMAYDDQDGGIRKTESTTVRRDESSKSIEVTVRIDADVDAIDDAIALLSCWWLRWIDRIDCAFFPHDYAWHMHCRIDPPEQSVLSHVLRDMLAIRNALCL